MESEFFFGKYTRPKFSLSYNTTQQSVFSLRSHTESVKRVQKNATGIVTNLGEMRWEEKREFLNLPKLEARKMSEGNIAKSKSLRGPDDVNSEQFFEARRESRPKGHSWTLGKGCVSRDVRKHLFSNRVMETGNKLIEEEINATTIGIFKTNITKK